MREMDRRKRVEAIMSSKLFREELERVVSDSLKDSGADGLTKMLSNMMNVKSSGGTTAISGNFLNRFLFQILIFINFRGRDLIGKRDSHKRYPRAWRHELHQERKVAQVQVGGSLQARWYVRMDPEYL